MDQDLYDEEPGSDLRPARAVIGSTIVGVVLWALFIFVIWAVVRAQP